MFNILKSVESRISSALKAFTKAKKQLENVNKEIDEITKNLQEEIDRTQNDLISLNAYKKQNLKVIEKLNDFMQ